MRRLIPNALFLFLVFTTPWALAQPQTVPKHLVEAKNLVKNTDLSRTSYKHGDGKIVWTGVTESHCDCSAFLDLLFIHSYGYTRDDLKKWFGAARPTAARWHTAVVKQKGFTEIKVVKDA